jgi:hypothetical protein
LDFATSQAFQQVANKLSLLTQQLNPEIIKPSKKTKKEKELDLKINVRLASQKSKANSEQETVKTLTIT